MRSLRRNSLLISTFIHIPALAADRETRHINEFKSILDKCAEYCRKFMTNI